MITEAWTSVIVTEKALRYDSKMQTLPHKISARPAQFSVLLYAMPNGGPPETAEAKRAFPVG